MRVDQIHARNAAILKSLDKQEHLLPAPDCSEVARRAFAERVWIPFYAAGQREPVTYIESPPTNAAAHDAWRKAKEAAAAQRRDERALLTEGRIADLEKAHADHEKASKVRWYETASADQIKASMYKMMEADEPDMEALEVAAGYRAAAEVREEDEPNPLKVAMQRPLHEGDFDGAVWTTDMIFKWGLRLLGAAAIVACVTTGTWALIPFALFVMTFGDVTNIFTGSQTQLNRRARTAAEADVAMRGGYSMPFSSGRPPSNPRKPGEHNHRWTSIQGDNYCYGCNRWEDCRPIPSALASGHHCSRMTRGCTEHH